MNRRSYLAATAGIASAAAAGCLGGKPDAEPSMSDDEHLAALRAEIDERGVEYGTVELEEAVVAVEHGYEDDPNDAIAEVAMAFVERVVDGWDVDRLAGRLRDGGTDWAWHAEAEWAREYADGEIGPEEYGSRLSETMEMRPDSER